MKFSSVILIAPILAEIRSELTANSDLHNWADKAEMYTWLESNDSQLNSTPLRYDVSDYGSTHVLTAEWGSDLIFELTNIPDEATIIYHDATAWKDNFNPLGKTQP